MPGSSFFISLNGRRFAVAQDLDPQVIIGGLTTTNALDNGDGSSEPQKRVIPGAIKGLSVRLRAANGDGEALQALAGLSSLSMRYRGPDASYAGQGFLTAGDDGLQNTQSESKSSDFDFVCAFGQPLEKL